MLPVLAADDPGWPSLRQLWDVAFGVEPARYFRGQGRSSQQLMRGADDDELDRMLSSERRLSARLRLAAALGVPRHVKDEPEHRVAALHTLAAAATKPEHFELLESAAADDVVLATTHHGRPFASAVARGQLLGVQFHPERSGDVGMTLLQNVVALAQAHADGLPVTA